MLRAFFLKELSETRLAWSLTIGVVLLVNWWGFFRWSDNELWQFHEFVFLVFWATTHYLLAVSIYPYEFMDTYTEELRRKFLLGAMLTVSLIDVVETSIRGNLFDPWYYLLFIGYISGLVIVAMLLPRPAVLRAIGWILFSSILIWSTVVRNVLVS